MHSRYCASMSHKTESPSSLELLRMAQTSTDLSVRQSLWVTEWTFCQNLTIVVLGSSCCTICWWGARWYSVLTAGPIGLLRSVSRDAMFSWLTPRDTPTRSEKTGSWFLTDDVWEIAGGQPDE